MLRRAWQRPVHRLAVATAATTCSARRARMAWAGCRRRSTGRSCWNGLVALRRPPTIEPIVARAQPFSAHRPHRKIAYEGLRSASPVNTILTPGELLGTRGAMPARAFIGPQCVGRIIDIFRQHVGEHDGVL